MQHVQLFLFDRELEILHVAEILFQRFADFFQFLVGRADDRIVRHFGNRLGSADAGDDVFALGVDEIFAVENVFAGGRIAGEGDAGGAIVAHVAEDHALHVDGGAPFIGDFVLLAVEDGAFVHPGAEHGADGALQLIERIGREFLAGAFLDERFEAIDEFLQVGFVEVRYLPVTPRSCFRPSITSSNGSCSFSWRFCTPITTSPYICTKRR